MRGTSGRSSGTLSSARSSLSSAFVTAAIRARAVADQRALRESGRPAGVDEIRGRGFVDRRRRRVGSPGGLERLVAELRRSGRARPPMTTTRSRDSTCASIGSIAGRRSCCTSNTRAPALVRIHAHSPGVQPVVQQGQDQSGAGDAVLALDVFRDVAGQDRHPVAGFRDRRPGRSASRVDSRANSANVIGRSSNTTAGRSGQLVAP